MLTVLSSLPEPGAVSARRAQKCGATVLRQVVVPRLHSSCWFALSVVLWRLWLLTFVGVFALDFSCWECDAERTSGAMWGMLQCCPWRPGVHGSQMLNSNDSILPSLVGSWLASPELILNVAALHRETAMNNASAVMTAAEEDASRAQCNDSCPLAAPHSQTAL